MKSVKPQDIDKIIEILKEKDWIVSSFENYQNLYSPKYYHSIKDLFQTEYYFLLDRNILSYIISSHDNLDKTNYRAAIGLIVFCQISDITFDISLAIHEYIEDKNKIHENMEIIANSYITNKKIINLSPAKNEIDIFYQIDNNKNIGELINFALGKSEKYILTSHNSTKDIQKVQEWYANNFILKEWKSMYIIILKIVYTFSIKKMKNHDGFSEVFDWMNNQYLYSLVGIVFALYIFSNKSKKKLMKYKLTKDSETNKHSIINMTWDLFIMNNYFTKLKQDSKNKKYLIVSADKDLKNILRIAINFQMSNNFTSMKTHFDKNDYAMVDYIKTNYHPEKKDRMFIPELSCFKDKKHREKLITELEKKLF